MKCNLTNLKSIQHNARQVGDIDFKGGSLLQLCKAIESDRI
jgi:hypothetical protein